MFIHVTTTLIITKTLEAVSFQMEKRNLISDESRKKFKPLDFPFYLG